MELMKTNPCAALDEAMSHILELGSIVDHMKDDLDERGGELYIPEMDHTKLAKAEMEKTWWKNAALGKLKEAQLARHERNLVQDELAVGNHDVDVLRRENVALKERAEELEKKVVSMEGELARVAPKAVAERFLACIAFIDDTPLACENLLKYVVHRELRKLGKIYMFIPEQVGFLEIPEGQRAKSLRGYSWDENEDKIINP